MFHLLPIESNLLKMCFFVHVLYFLCIIFVCYISCVYIYIYIQYIYIQYIYIQYIYIQYISGHKWSTKHKVLKSLKSKMGIIYRQSWKQWALLVIITMALWQLMHLDTQCTVCPYAWVATKPLGWKLGGHIIVFVIADIYI